MIEFFLRLKEQHALGRAFGRAAATDDEALMTEYLVKVRNVVENRMYRAAAA